MARIQRLFYSTSPHFLGVVEEVPSKPGYGGPALVGLLMVYSGEHFHENQLPLLYSFVIVSIIVNFFIPLWFPVYCSYLSL